jgi:tetratricopeptide (TPR) repeat protein
VHEVGDKSEVSFANIMLCGTNTLPALEQTQVIEENLKIFEKTGDPVIRNEALMHLAHLALLNQDWERAEALYQETIRLSKESRHFRMVAPSYRGLGMMAFQNGDYDKAKDYCLESLSYARQIEYKMVVIQALHLLSDISLVQEEYEAAKDFLQESLAIDLEKLMSYRTSALSPVKKECLKKQKCMRERHGEFLESSKVNGALD